MNCSQRWTIADVIDFEYLLDRERDGTLGIDSQRVDAAFQTKTLPDLQAAGDLSRQVVFRRWLDVKRDTAAMPLLGEYWKTAWQLLILLSTISGTMAGGSLTATLLLYRGDVPVNVPWIVACTLGVQMLLLFVAAALWLIRRTTGFLDDFRPLRPLLNGLMWAMSASLRKLPGDQRESLRTIFARFDRRREIYGSLATWPFLIVTQVFGVGFNLGILGVLLAHVAFKDIEFGWQSSFVQSDEVAYGIASGMATPWKWFAPNPHPTLAEVTNSHFRYKEERSNTSWWPFLCYSVACYGLLVRGGLLVFAGAKLRSSMRRLTFDHEGCPSLYRRLIGPTVRSQGDTPALEVPSAAVAEARRAVCGEAIALVSEDVELSEDRLTNYIRDSYGWDLAAVHKAQVDHPSGNAEILAAITEKAVSLVGIIVVVPAERPPIKAIAIFIGKIAKAAGSKLEVVLLLVGRKEAGGFAAVDQENFGYWQNLVTINKLQVSLEQWSNQ